MCWNSPLPTKSLIFFFFFNDTATTEIYTLSLHDALPIPGPGGCPARAARHEVSPPAQRSEEHTSELQSRGHLVCRLLLEKKKNTDEQSPFNRKHMCNTLRRHTWWSL